MLHKKIKRYFCTPILIFLSFSLFAADIKESSNLYDNAQVLRWLNKENFVIGKWDGSISIFKVIKKDEQLIPVLSQLLSPPARQGVQMITTLTPNIFVTSNDATSLTVWEQENNSFKEKFTSQYAAAIGNANSGVVFKNADTTWFVSGHENGSIIIWKVMSDGMLNLYKVVDVRSPNPLPPPYNKNIRGLVYWKDNLIISGGEDGDIAFISIPDGNVISRTRYNPKAEKGISSLAIKDNYLLLGNYPNPTRRDEKNLWLYKLTAPSVINFLDAMNITTNSNKLDVYTFDTALSYINNGLHFFATSGEGMLWYGLVKDDRLRLIGRKKIEDLGGAALAVNNDSPWILAVAQHVLRLFVTA